MSIFVDPVHTLFSHIPHHIWRSRPHVDGRAESTAAESPPGDEHGGHANAGCIVGQGETEEKETNKEREMG